MMSFPAKILLFGEYGLLAGKRGFALPFTGFSGHLSLEKLQLPQVPQSNRNLFQLYNYFSANREFHEKLDLKTFHQELKKGIWFNSTIPEGAGVGSSGALVAAIYDRYAVSKESDIVLLKSDLASIEKFFHGSSSGIDPTVSYLNKPLLVSDQNETHVLDLWEFNLVGLNVYLVDTGMKSDTRELVYWFKNELKKPGFLKAAERDFFQVSDQVIGSLEYEQPVIFDDVMSISDFQFEYLKPLIPTSFLPHFEYGVKTREFAFKLCGSGGGGYMLCFSKTRNAEAYFKEQQLNYISIQD